MKTQDLRQRIESGHMDTVGAPVDLRVELREERLTIRFSVEEVRAIDREARALGVGRSTVIRMLVRQGLGFEQGQARVSTGKRGKPRRMVVTRVAR